MDTPHDILEYDERDALWLLQEKYHGVKNTSYEEDIVRLKKGEPLAYIIGFTPFLHTKIYLDSHPLIPRPETEWWTELFLLSLQKGVPYHVLDLCAGSGAIGSALLKNNPHLTVTFAEIREDHIETIEKNLKENGIARERTQVVRSDLFQHISGPYDYIVTNPPYVPQTRTIASSVTEYEPVDALFSGKDGSNHIKKILAEAKNYLSKHGQLWCEIDITHEQMAPAYAQEHGARSAEIRKDQYGLPRLLVAHY